MYFHCRDDRGPSVHLTLLMALPLWNQRLGTRFGSRFPTRCGRTGYSDGPILMALGKHDVLPVRGKLMRRFFAVIYFQPVSHFHKNKRRSSFKLQDLLQTRGSLCFLGEGNCKTQICLYLSFMNGTVFCILYLWDRILFLLYHQSFQ